MTSSSNITDNDWVPCPECGGEGKYEVEVAVVDHMRGGYLQDVTVLQDVAVMQKIGVKTKMGIRKTDGTFEIYDLTVTDAKTKKIVLATPETYETTTGGPFDPATIPKIDFGCVAYFGPTDSVGIRAIVKSIQPDADLSAQIVAYDEAPELWS